ncbi:hypothetical protein [Chitinolyticbacter meiyuanensis]|uniref:hypothetical protein n=1 Tax=Chitinolyticbacter meiyuanensis TaxID=682798 RepID=UPI001652B1FF|nr:hypothetical protein [Chitinolyticbacter meiyuanensis]
MKIKIRFLMDFFMGYSQLIKILLRKKTSRENQRLIVRHAAIRSRALRQGFAAFRASAASNEWWLNRSPSQGSNGGRP